MQHNDSTLVCRQPPPTQVQRRDDWLTACDDRTANEKLGVTGQKKEIRSFFVHKSKNSSASRVKRQTDRSVGCPRARVTHGPRLTRVGRSARADAQRRSRAASERVGRSAGPGSEPAPRGGSGRSVGDVQFKINFAPPRAICQKIARIPATTRSSCRISSMRDHQRTSSGGVKRCLQGSSATCPKHDRHLILPPFSSTYRKHDPHSILLTRHS